MQVAQEALVSLGSHGAEAYSGPRLVGEHSGREEETQAVEGGVLLLVGAFENAGVFHPRYGQEVKRRFVLPEARERAVAERMAGISALFEAPTFGVHVTSLLDFEFFQSSAADRAEAGERDFWVVLCAPAAASVCADSALFLQSLPAVYIVEPHMYSEIEALGILRLCDRQIVSDALSWWAAYLSSKPGPRVVGREFWEDADGVEYVPHASLFDTFAPI